MITMKRKPRSLVVEVFFATASGEAPEVPFHEDDRFQWSSYRPASASALRCGEPLKPFFDGTLSTILLITDTGGNCQ